MKPTKGQTRSQWMKVAVAHLIEQGEAEAAAISKAAQIFDEETATARHPESVTVKAAIKRRGFSADEVAQLCKARGLVYREGDENYVAVIEVTNERVDRDSDVVEIGGGDFKNFLQNPVLMYGHNLSGTPVGAVLSLDKEKDAKGVPCLLATVIFHRIDELSENVAEMFKLGFLRATSIGFLAKRGGVYSPTEKERSDMGMSPWGVVFRAWELIEISVCAVPANPYALTRETAKSLSREAREFGRKEGFIEMTSDCADLDSEAEAEAQRKAKAEQEERVTAARKILADRLAKTIRNSPTMMGNQTPASKLKKIAERLEKFAG